MQARWLTEGERKIISDRLKNQEISIPEGAGGVDETQHVISRELTLQNFVNMFKLYVVKLKETFKYLIGESGEVVE